MPRRFALGDGIAIAGIGVYFVFLVILFGYHLAESTFGIPALGQLVLVLLAGMPIAALVASFRNPEYLALQYAFAGFVLLLRLSGITVLNPVRGTPSGLDFFVMAGALAVGVGAFLVHVRVRAEQRAAKEAGAGPLERRLTELTRLKDQGLISPEEFGRKRQDALDGHA
jgi:hypothetical protein